TAHGRLTIDEHRAGTANPLLATEMQTREGQLIAQHIGQRIARIDRNPPVDAIHAEFDRYGLRLEVVGHQALSDSPKHCRSITTSPASLAVAPTLRPWSARFVRAHERRTRSLR